MANKILKYLVIVALGLLVISILSLLFGGPSFSENDVVVTIDGPTQASVGDEVVYKINYKNNTKVVLQGIKFRFFYPTESVVLKNGNVASDLTESFDVGDLSPGQSGTKEFRAFLVGDRGDIKTAKTDMTFNAGTLRSSFQKSASLSTTVVNVPITLTLVAPPNSVSGQSVTYMLDYRNESGANISDLRFEFAYPDGFTPQSYSPSPTRGNNIWDLKLVKNGTGDRISITGILTGSEENGKLVTLKLERKIGDQYVDYERSSSTTIIANPILGLNMTVNNVTDYSANLGEQLNYKIRYSNDSNFNLNGLNLQVQFEGDMYDFGALNANNGFFDNSSKTISWNSDVINDFSNFTPGLKGEVNFSIKLKPQFTSGLPGTSRDRFVKATAHLVTPNVPPNLGGLNVSNSSNLTTKITSQPTLNQFSYYSDPKLGSSGPLPPHSGQETIFTVYWQLANPGNDISGTEVSATVPAGIQVDSFVSTSFGLSAPQYNPNTSEMLWKVGTLPYGIGNATPRYEAVFRLKIKPTSSQSGRPIELLKNVKLVGNDSFTKQAIFITAPNLTTDNLVDRPNEGKVQ